MRRPGQNSSSVRYFSGRTVTLFNLFLFCTSLYLYLLSRHSNYDESVEKEMPYDDSKQPVHNGASLSSSLTDITSAKEDTGSASASSSVSLQDGQSMDFSSSPCSDPVWCDIPMPKKSYFNFDPPTNIERWKLARLQAAAGEQVLLKRIAKVFPSSFDFLDGDIGFRRMHYAFDFFVDDRRDLTPLTPPPPGTPLRNNERLRRRRVTPDTGAGVEYESRRILQKTVITGPKMVNGKLYYPWELEKKRVIPDPYDFRAANRSAVVSVGYTAYTRDSNSYFTGNRLGAAYIDRNKFFDYWKQVKDNIDLPFIAVCIGNENWGMLSTMFPNRTAGWGRCCDTPKTKIVWDFLNHEKTLMLVTNQHVNMSHPKLLVMPRGIPLTWGFTRFIVWDAIRNTLKNVRKQTLLFAAASNWGPRPQILRCISAKVPAELFDGHINTPKTNRLSREMYYQKLGSAMFGVGLPGLGYDTFRYVQ